MRLSQLVFFASLSVAVVAEGYVIHISYLAIRSLQDVIDLYNPYASWPEEGQSIERSFGLVLTAWTTEMAQSSPVVAAWLQSL